MPPDAFIGVLTKVRNHRRGERLHPQKHETDNSFINGSGCWGGSYCHLATYRLRSDIGGNSCAGSLEFHFGFGTGSDNFGAGDFDGDESLGNVFRPAENLRLRGHRGLTRKVSWSWQLARSSPL
jgi:hypothetical protein